MQRPLTQTPRRLRALAPGHLSRFSTRPGRPRAMSYADFVYDQLYHPDHGYFAKQTDTQLGALPKPIPFGLLMGFSDYTRTLSQAYPSGKFLTPSEIFRPYYGMSLAKMILGQSHQEGIKDLSLVEVGCGMGGNANSVLGYYQVSAPDAYSRLHYTLVDISPVAIRECKRLIGGGHKELVAQGRLKWVMKDVAEAGLVDKRPTFVILLEILDNLTHQKVRVSQDLSSVEESWIEVGEDGQGREVWRELSDPDVIWLFKQWADLYAPKGQVDLSSLGTLGWVHRAAERVRGAMGKKRPLEIYLPVGFVRVVRSITVGIPDARFVISDFSSLPVDRPGARDAIEFNPPVIQTKLSASHESKEFASILEPEFGTADIFFPTDFAMAQRVLEAFQKREYVVQTPPEFFRQYAETRWANTRSGYNPMVEDFANTRFLYPRGQTK